MGSIKAAPLFFKDLIFFLSRERKMCVILNQKTRFSNGPVMR